MIKSDIESLKEISKSYPFAYLTLCELGMEEYIDNADQNDLYYGHYIKGKRLIDDGKDEEGLKELNYAAEKGILSSYIQIAWYYQEKCDFENSSKYFKKAGEKGLIYGYTEYARSNLKEGLDILKTIPLTFTDVMRCCDELKILETEKEDLMKSMKNLFKDHFFKLFDISIINQKIH